MKLVEQIKHCYITDTLEVCGMTEKTVGERLASLRRANNYSLRTVGAAVDKSAATVLRWENGESDPSRADIVKLAELYNQDAVWLQWGVKPRNTERRTQSIIGKLPLLSDRQLDHVDDLIDLLIAGSKEENENGDES